MPIRATRALLHAALSGTLAGVGYRTDPVFGFGVPVEVPDVDSKLLDPRSTWRDPEAYDRKARRAGRMFRDELREVHGRRIHARVGRAAPVVLRPRGRLR